MLLTRIASGHVATLTGPDGITVRLPVGARHTAWPDIQAIEIQADPSAVADAGVIAEYVVMYDRHGRQTLLPHLNSKTVFTLHEDVTELRALWERLRGKDWVALPEVTEKMARTQRHMNRHRGIVAGVAAWGRCDGDRPGVDPRTPAHRGSRRFRGEHAHRGGLGVRRVGRRGGCRTRPPADATGGERPAPARTRRKGLHE
ncbi:hypothetical protein [Streptomyces alanosinicus]|uniref:hypothetical protein n=1 Tax=Streptomyces alanosinicus TaxID=68171 RepID=UPI001674086F|nr:hypothetical protein [Streptomyces alanosinicus]